MYEIKVIDPVKGEVGLDMNESSFPITIENGSIADLTDRSATWSYSIEIPKTTDNKKLLELVGTPFVNTRIPYRRILCNVYADGIRIISNGVLFIESVTNTKYDIQIVSGNADVFERMRDIEFKKWTKAHWTALPKKSIPEPDQTKAYLYATQMIVSKDIDKNIGTHHIHELTVGTRDKYGTYVWASPLLRIAGEHSALATILEDIGYTLETDTNLDNLYFAMANRDRGDFGNDPIASYDIQLEHNTYTTPNAPYWEKLHVDTSDTQMEMERVRYHFYAWFQADMGTGQSFPSFVAAGGKMYVQFTWAGGAGEVFEFDTSNRYATEFEFETDMLLTPDIPEIGVRIWSSSNRYTYAGVVHEGYDAADAEATIELYAPDGDNYIYPGQTINLEWSTGYETALDMFKVLAQAFGWIIKVDGEQKIIEARTFDYIIQRKSIAKDWSSKVVNGETEMTFTFGDYAKNNYITLAENKHTEYEDKATFTIDNENLETSFDAVNVGISSGAGNVVEQYRYEEGEGYYRWLSTGKPHMLISADRSRVSHYDSAMIKANYAGLIQTMQDTQVIREKMTLSQIDILGFDQFTPVYLKQYGAYFYVNKISDWEAGQICEVELIKI